MNTSVPPGFIKLTARPRCCATCFHFEFVDALSDNCTKHRDIVFLGGESPLDFICSNYSLEDPGLNQVALAAQFQIGDYVKVYYDIGTRKKPRGVGRIVGIRARGQNSAEPFIWVGGIAGGWHPGACEIVTEGAYPETGGKGVN